MTDIIYPVDRLLSNPKIFFALAAKIEGPDAMTLKDLFYELLESDMDSESEGDEIEFHATEVCIRQSPDEPGVIQMILDTGTAAELRPQGEYLSNIRNDEEMQITTNVYRRLVSAIEESSPQFIGDVVLCEPPLPSNSYLRSEDGNSFNGKFHLLSNPDITYDFTIDVIDIQNDQLKATIYPD